MNVKINGSKTYVPVAEAAKLCNRSERTIRRWIAKKYVRVVRNKQTRSVRIDLDDIQRMQANKPDTVHPVRDEIEELKLDNQELEQEVESLKQEVGGLKEQLAILQEREEVLEKRVDFLSQQRVGTGNLLLFPRRAPRVSGAESRGLPPGTQRLVPYVALHKANVSEVKALHTQRLIELTLHMREGEVKRNKQEWWITPEQQVQLVRYWQEHHVPYTPCGQCQGCMEQAQNNEIG
jgi:hypothetical protein